jgi:hypothetical protein
MDSGVWKFEIITAFTQIGRIRFLVQHLKCSNGCAHLTGYGCFKGPERETEKIEEQRLDVIYQH